jgi:DNA-binding transcriptional MerR regulator
MIVEPSFLTIGAAARAVRRSVETLRKWEQRGLVTPLRDDVGRRLYGPEHIEVLQRLANRSADVALRG